MLMQAYLSYMLWDINTSKCESNQVLCQKNAQIVVNIIRICERVIVQNKKLT